MSVISPLNQLELRWQPDLGRYSPSTDSDTYFIFWKFRFLLLVDGRPLVDDPKNDYSYDLGELVRSLHNSGSYYLITCACGDASCLGIKEAVAVTHQDNCVAWHITQPLMLSLRFDYQAYAAAVHTARQEFLQFLHQASPAIQEGELSLTPMNFWHWPFVQEDATWV